MQPELLWRPYDGLCADLLNFPLTDSMLCSNSSQNSLPPPLLPSQDPTIWASLAAMAMAAKELNTAEVAFAAIDEVDKLHFVLKVSFGYNQAV